MSNARKLDSKRRLVFPETFQPGDVFLEEDVSPKGIRFSLVKREEVPVIDVDVESDWPWLSPTLDRATIAKAIREDRDAR